MITGRSGALRRLGIHVMTGIIDNGYRGEILAGCWNLNPHPVHVLRGDRVFQLIVMPLVTPEIEVVRQLGPSERGDRGFGSTGVSAPELRG